MGLASPWLNLTCLRRAVDQLVHAASSRFEQLERAQQPATRHATGQDVKVLKEQFSSLKNSWTQSEVRDTFLDGSGPALRGCVCGFCPTVAQQHVWIQPCWCSLALLGLTGFHGRSSCGGQAGCR